MVKSKTVMPNKALHLKFCHMKEEIVIRRRKGDMFSIVPKTPSRRSPFDVPNLGKRIARKEILEAIRESRERA